MLFRSFVYVSQSRYHHNAERLQKLKELFPDLFTVEGKIDEKELQKLVNPENIHETERYEFRWFGKSQAKRNAFTPTNATFIFDENRSVNPENTAIVSRVSFSINSTRP